MGVKDQFTAATPDSQRSVVPLGPFSPPVPWPPSFDLPAMTITDAQTLRDDCAPRKNARTTQTHKEPRWRRAQTKAGETRLQRSAGSIRSRCRSYEKSESP